MEAGKRFSTKDTRTTALMGTGTAGWGARGTDLVYLVICEVIVVVAIVAVVYVGVVRVMRAVIWAGQGCRMLMMRAGMMG